MFTLKRNHFTHRPLVMVECDYLDTKVLDKKTYSTSVLVK